LTNLIFLTCLLYYIFSSSGNCWYDDTLQYVREAQDARFAEDVWHEVVEEYLSDKKGVTIQMILTDALKMDIDRCDKMARNRIADILRQLNWKTSTHVFINVDRGTLTKRALLFTIN